MVLEEYYIQFQSASGLWCGANPTSLEPRSCYRSSSAQAISYAVKWMIENDMRYRVVVDNEGDDRPIWDSDEDIKPVRRVNGRRFQVGD